MIIRKEIIRTDGVKLTLTYSDQGFKIRKINTEELYDEALDVLDYTYEETNEKAE